MSGWLGILRARVEASNQAEVAKTLGISRTAICLVLAEKYQASTDRIEAKVLAIYGAPKIACPVLGEIEAGNCSGNRERAKAIGLRTGNPQTARLFKTCLNCPVVGAIKKGDRHAVAENHIGKGKARRAAHMGG
jgi:hypothetical protein